MKKYAIGFVCGALLASASVVYAADAIKATLFPVKYVVNGEQKDLSTGYHTINVEGRAYVPVRFIAESLDAVVVYDDASKSIELDNTFHMKSMYTRVKAGHLQVKQEGNGSLVTGKLYVGQSYWDSFDGAKFSFPPGTEVNVGGRIAFYDADGVPMAKENVSFPLTAGGDRMLDFEFVTETDVSNYDYASLESVGPEPLDMFLPPPAVHVSDATNSLGICYSSMIRDGDYTKIQYELAVLKPERYRFNAKVDYYDELGKLLGTAHIAFTGQGPYEIEGPGSSDYPYTYETAAKGDVTGAASYKLTVEEMEVISD
ncbi:copper amine oxidase N-terminal domain-containing protein [Paenibacillus sp. J5C_2022]|uniref:copper amine oxidase N-terminal domain-containing protein n=1 Tax=Paenibacillus sp. J5C2022 TaxID=2977129 RepID=UPI0021D3A29A|nr:copper amine oxidase N-terminal domain-containing protein [Paenibacillus sp. J5C2022]MCU6711882.1 copper amine oxidase N-terminal domain-containing protein [Paenibacillus sp. J5C2022]